MNTSETIEAINAMLDRSRSDLDRSYSRLKTQIFGTDGYWESALDWWKAIGYNEALCDVKLEILRKSVLRNPQT